MKPTATLRLDHLVLRNFRCFASCEVDFHPRLTVLVAENGRGKTAILDGIATALGPLVDELAQTRAWRGIDHGDVRLVQGADGQMAPVLPSAVEARGVVDGERLIWGMRLNGVAKRARTSSKELKSLRKQAVVVRSRLDAYAHQGRELAPPLPLVAYYGTGRLWAEHRLTERRKRRDSSPMGRLSGYNDCLSSASSFKSFVDWYEGAMNAERNPTSIAFHPDERPYKLVSAVREATRVVLAPTRWEVLDWQFPPKDEYGNETGLGYLVVEHPVHGRLPVSRLSDGVRNMVALVADVAHRCARLNPQFGEEAARRTPGVLLIDEVDMHLHPGWQQEITELLHRAFPQMQLIVTTHSPQVLSTVDASCIRVLDVVDGRGDLDTPSVQTLGVESADVLARIMGVSPTPDVEEARKLSRYRALIQQGLAEGVEATSLRGVLETHYGPQHPLMVECKRLLRLQKLKPRLGPTGGP